MAKQTPFNIEQETTMVADTPLAMQSGLFKSIKNAISMNIGLCEIRMNLFLWDLFRTCKQKQN